MPELTFRLRWPDATETLNYSPSTIIATYFEVGRAYGVAEFAALARRALQAASDRVKETHGYPLRARRRNAGDDRTRIGKIHRQCRSHRAGAQRMSAPHYEVAIIGGGQAGLSLSWHMAQAGINHVVFEREQTFHAWKQQRWDSFCLVTPNWQVPVAGVPLPRRSPARLHGERRDHPLC